MANTTLDDPTSLCFFFLLSCHFHSPQSLKSFYFLQEATMLSLDPKPVLPVSRIAGMVFSVCDFTKPALLTQMAFSHVPAYLSKGDYIS